MLLAAGDILTRRRMLQKRLISTSQIRGRGDAAAMSLSAASDSTPRSQIFTVDASAAGDVRRRRTTAARDTNFKYARNHVA